MAALDTAGDAAPSRQRAEAMLLAAWLEASTGDLDHARNHIATAIELAEAIDDRRPAGTLLLLPRLRRVAPR